MPTNPPEPLGTLRFKNIENGRTIGAIFYTPTYRSWVDEKHGTLSGWVADYEIEIDGARTRKTSHGETWLQALLLAIERLRIEFPANQEELWETADGLPTWCVLPRTVRFSWGYQIYKNAECAMELVTDSFVAGVEERFRGREGQVDDDPSKHEKGPPSSEPSNV